MRTALLLAALWSAASVTQDRGQDPESWTAAIAPVKIIDNIYYVGTVDLASYLITSPAGHILIETGVPENADRVAASIAALGFQLRDVRIILTTQAHYDHVGGHAAMKTKTGARVLVSREDAPVVEGGGKGDYHFGPAYYFPAVHVDGLLADGEKIRLGGVELVAHLTPGHTKGTTTWTTQARDASGSLKRVVFAGSTTVNPGVKLVGNTAYPAIATDFQRTFAILQSLPCDVFLAAHGSQFGGPEKIAAARAGASTNPFIDPDAYRRAIERSRQAFEAELKRQSR